MASKRVDFGLVGREKRENADMGQEAYRKWVCSSLVPYFAHRSPKDVKTLEGSWTGPRLRPCRSFCQTVEQRCPYFLPGDRAPAYPTQYAGEPTFLCRVISKKGTNVQLAPCLLRKFAKNGTRHRQPVSITPLSVLPLVHDDDERSFGVVALSPQYRNLHEDTHKWSPCWNALHKLHETMRTFYAGGGDVSYSYPNIPETGEQAARALHSISDDECCFHVCSEDTKEGICTKCEEPWKHGKFQDPATAPQCEPPVNLQSGSTGPGSQPGQPETSTDDLDTSTTPSSSNTTASSTTVGQKDTAFCGSGRIGSISSASSLGRSNPSIVLQFFWLCSILITLPANALQYNTRALECPFGFLRLIGSGLLFSGTPASPTSSSTTPTSTSSRPAFLEVPTRLISNEAAKGRANDIVFASVNFVIRDITTADLVARDPGMKGEEGGNEITLTREKNADESKVGNRVRGKGLTSGSRECARG
ncbi:hypothetical protein ALC57_00563 [Trachymyrmex cornetzi]|uniref:Uncharacterized protein n=1 Tax=Trachymyrmex cornetzi TaxID=471704 RepID=A0A151JRI0_9HYME|nr:hypothetical protein ALC57_00563 [Trachymyrmex cornetzi]